MDRTDGAVYLAEVLRSMAHPARVRILRLLGKGRKSVGELSADLGIEQPNMSQHLAAMRRTGVLRVDREGTRANYSVCCPDVSRLLDAAEAISRHCAVAQTEALTDPTRPA